MVKKQNMISNKKDISNRVSYNDAIKHRPLESYAEKEILQWILNRFCQCAFYNRSSLYLLFVGRPIICAKYKIFPKQTMIGKDSDIG